MIDQALRDKLLAAASVTALVSNRIFQAPLPQSTILPAISFSRVSTPERLLSHSGPVKGAAAVFQFSAWSENPATAKDLASKIRATLHGWSGDQSGETIYWTQVINEVDLFDIDLGYQVMTDVLVTHKEI